MNKHAIDVAVGDKVIKGGLIRAVTKRKVYRKQNEEFKRVRLTLENGQVLEFREKFRVGVAP